MTTIDELFDSDRSKKKPPSADALSALEQGRALLTSKRSARPEKAKISRDRIKGFYQSWQWNRLRFRVLKEHGRRCVNCGATPETGARIVVDHIKPVRHFWSLRLVFENCRPFCDDCNRGRGSPKDE
jgi:5-methylcytosine-specific restriction protein A